ncbi:MAG TPA: hypothetical protein VHO03_16660 [Ignavibacteriales bacterium]|nr:hypothetical protein [Ignavibacteriales bacterium]
MPLTEEESKIVMESIAVHISIKEKVKKGELPLKGSIECPVCKRMIYYRANPYKKSYHVWLKCETEGCLSIME